MENIIEIKRTNFQRKSAYFQLVNYVLFSTLGIVSIFWDWKASIAPVICVIIFYLLQRKIDFRSNVIWFIIGFLALSISLSWIFSLSFGLFIVQCLLLAAIKPAIDVWKETNQEHTDVIFSMSSDYFACLCPENSDYKGYAMNPMGYKKRFPMADIISVQRDGKSLLIALKERTIRPRELHADEIEMILAYFRKNKPAVLAAVETKSIRKEEDRVYWVKFIVIGIPCILGGLSLYFWADNGRNTVVTILSIVAAIVLGIILLKITNMVSRHKAN